MKIGKAKDDFKLLEPNQMRASHADRVNDPHTLLLPVTLRFPFQPPMPAMHPALTNEPIHDHIKKFRSDMLLLDEEFLHLSRKLTIARDSAQKIVLRREDWRVENERQAQHQIEYIERHRVEFFILKRANRLHERFIIKRARFNALAIMKRLETQTLESAREELKETRRGNKKASGFGWQGQPAISGWATGSLRDSFERIAQTLKEHFRHEIPEHKRILHVQYERFLFYLALRNMHKRVEREHAAILKEDGKIKRLEHEDLHRIDLRHQVIHKEGERQQHLALLKKIAKHQRSEHLWIQSAQFRDKEGFLYLEKVSLKSHDLRKKNRQDAAYLGQGFGHQGQPLTFGWADGSLRDTHESTLQRQVDFTSIRLPEHKRLAEARTRKLAYQQVSALQQEVVLKVEDELLHAKDKLTAMRHARIDRQDRRRAFEKVVALAHLQSDLNEKARLDAGRGYLRIEKLSLQNAKTWLRHLRHGLHRAAGFGDAGQVAQFGWAAGSLRDSAERQATNRRVFLATEVPADHRYQDVITKRIYQHRAAHVALKLKAKYNLHDQVMLKNRDEAKQLAEARQRHEAGIAKAKEARRHQDLLLQVARFDAIKAGVALARAAVDEANHVTKKRRKDLHASAGFGTQGQPALSGWDDFSLRATSENSARSHKELTKQDTTHEHLKELTKKMHSLSETRFDKALLDVKKKG